MKDLINNIDNLDNKMSIATEKYLSGYTCSQAVFCAFAEDFGIDEQTAKQIFCGFGGGFGGLQEVCGAFSGATAVISYYYSARGATKAQVYAAVQRAAQILETEYGGITCRDILRGEKPQPFKCEMKVKDAVLIVSKVLTEMPQILSEVI